MPRGPQKTPQGASLPEVAVKPQGPVERGRRSIPAQPDEPAREGVVKSLMEQAVARDNMWAALRRVEQNGGAPGVDGMRVQDLRLHLREHWERIRSELLDGSYRPQPVKRVEIPKPGGGTRMLGIPVVVDRLVQQALLQVLTPRFDPHFSDSSFGFRPGRRGKEAVGRAREFVREGYRWVVDLDLEKFFDRVNHDILMSRVARRVDDKHVLRLIRRYLEAGILVDGVALTAEEGTPQGGPLSPVLANVLLDDLDKELERRGHRFVRYADDCNVYVRTRRAGERVMEGITKYLEQRLKLKVNQGKSAVDRPVRRQFLGFSLTAEKKARIRLAPRALKRVKDRLRDLTCRSRSQSMVERIKRINTFLRGWLAYFRLAETPRPFRELDEWLRRRLRACLWKQWKTAKARRRNLLNLGLKEQQARSMAWSRKGYWRIAGSPVLQTTLTIAYWRKQGLFSLAAFYDHHRQAW